MEQRIPWAGGRLGSHSGRPSKLNLGKVELAEQRLLPGKGWRVPRKPERERAHSEGRRRRARRSAYVVPRVQGQRRARVRWAYRG